MTVECLKNALALIENYFGRPLSTDERTARSQILRRRAQRHPG